jgi:hypothetical protein
MDLSVGNNVYVNQGSGISGQVCYVDEKNPQIAVAQLSGSFSGGTDVTYGNFQTASLQAPLGTTGIVSGDV